MGRAPDCRQLILLGGPEGSLIDLVAEYPVRTSPADRAADSTAGPKAVVDSAAAVITYPRRASGTPKGVVLSHAAMLHNASAIADTLYGRGNHDVHLVGQAGQGDYAGAAGASKDSALSG